MAKLAAVVIFPPELSNDDVFDRALDAAREVAPELDPDVFTVRAARPDEWPNHPRGPLNAVVFEFDA